MITTQHFPAAFPSPVRQQIQSYAYCVLDLETRDCDAKTIERVVAKKMENWEAPGNYKDPEKIAKLKEEARAKAGDKSGIWDEASIASIAIKSDTEFRLLHCLHVEEPHLVEGATVQGFASELAMLQALRGLINAAWVLKAEDYPDPGLAPQNGAGVILPPTHLVGHNIRCFDLPKIRLRMLANGMKLPAGLISHLPVFDTMQNWGRFSRDQRPFVPLADILDALGIPQHKGLIDGSQIETMIRAGKFEEVLGYALCDVASVERAFLMMTGRLGQ